MGNKGNNIKLVKAEILFTRQCPLRCPYCRMRRDNPTEINDFKTWKKVINRIYDWGVRFTPIYGAEPLTKPDLLGDYIEYSENKGITTTIITSGVIIPTERYPDVFSILKMLYERGLRSITVSVDANDFNSSVKRKGQLGIKIAEWWKSTFSEYRDIELITTITHNNLETTKDVIDYCMENGFYWSFDLLHLSRGQEGTKCAGLHPQLDSIVQKSTSKLTNIFPLSYLKTMDYYDGVEDVVFRSSDTSKLIALLDYIIEMKKRYGLIHQSFEVLNYMKNNIHKLFNYSWNCVRDTNVFPAFITIDSDGTLRFCDDFHPNDIKKKVWEIKTKKEFYEYAEKIKEAIATRCPGCFWTTHFDAMYIKSKDSIDMWNRYVHNT